VYHYSFTIRPGNQKRGGVRSYSRTTCIRLSSSDWVGSSRENSISLLNESHDSAFVHLLKSTDNLEFPESEYPPLQWYAICQSPSLKSVYALKKERRELEDDNESGLAEEPDEHLEDLIKIPSRVGSELLLNTRIQLENMWAIINPFPNVSKLALFRLAD
jgi:hypothetical protein